MFRWLPFLGWRSSSMPSQGVTVHFRFGGANKVVFEDGVAVTVLGRTGIAYFNGRVTLDVDSEITEGPEMVINAGRLQLDNPDACLDDRAMADIEDHLNVAPRALGYRDVDYIR